MLAQSFTRDGKFRKSFVASPPLLLRVSFTLNAWLSGSNIFGKSIQKQVIKLYPTRFSTQTDLNHPTLLSNDVNLVFAGFCANYVVVSYEFRYYGLSSRRTSIAYVLYGCDQRAFCQGRVNVCIDSSSIVQYSHSPFCSMSVYISLCCVVLCIKKGSLETRFLF